MNNYIISIQNLNIIYIFIILISVNIGLSYIICNLFRLLRKNFFPYYLCIIDEIMEIYYETYQLVLDTNLGYVYIYGLTGNTVYSRTEKYSLAKRFVRQGERDLKIAKEFSKQSRILNNVAPLMDKSGHGSLYDSFTESAKTFKDKAEVYEESAKFF